MTRRHVHEEELEASAERLFALLLTPSDIRAWWGAARAIVLPERRGLWAAAWGDDEDDPDYVTVATIAELDPPRRLVLADYRYRARSGALPFDSELRTEFVVTPVAAGRARLRVVQDGFPETPEADPFYAACDTGWQATFAGIRRHLGGTGAENSDP